MHRTFNRGLAVSALIAFCLMGAVQLSAAPKKPDLAPQYKKWVEQDVVYIITDEERKTFLNLTTDEDRERFISDFWEVRNPQRHSEHNAYKDEHYARMEYANAHFGHDSNTPGWRTDMGRAYILFGAPTSRHPFVGYSQIYPIELWMYENTMGAVNLPAYFYLMFYMDGDIGEYKFYRPYLDGPMKLVRGSQFNSNSDVYKFLQPLGGDVAHAVLSLVPSEPVDTVHYQPEMGSDILVSKIQNFANDPFNVRRLRELRSLRASVSSKLLVNDETPLPISTFVLADPIGQYWVDFSVPVQDASMGKVTQGGVVGPHADSRLTVATSFRLLGAAGDVIAEDEEEQSFLPFDSEGKFRPFELTGRLPVNPGVYKIEFRVMDRERSRVFTGEKEFMVAPDTPLNVSGPLAFATVKPAKPDGTAPFQYFGAQFLPLGEGTQAEGDPLRLLYALNLPAGAEGKDFTVEYLIAHLQDRDARVTAKDTVAAAEFRNGHLLKSKTIESKGLFAGPYRVVITVRGSDNQTLASASTSLHIGAKSETPLLFFLDSTHQTASPAGASYIRALEAISAKDKAGAVKYMKQALDLNKGNDFAARYLVQSYFETHDFNTITGVYRRVGIKPFETSAELMAQISLSFARTGDRQQAKEILDSARTLFPQDPVLAATAKAVSN